VGVYREHCYCAQRDVRVIRIEHFERDSVEPNQPVESPDPEVTIFCLGDGSDRIPRKPGFGIPMIHDMFIRSLQSSRGVITAMFELLITSAPVVPSGSKGPRNRFRKSRVVQAGRPSKDDRIMVEAMVYVLRTGCPWRDMPPRFGPWSSVYTRRSRWAQSGLWAAILDDFAEGGEATCVTWTPQT
jgi:hypothetical protein